MRLVERLQIADLFEEINIAHLQDSRRNCAKEGAGFALDKTNFEGGPQRESRLPSLTEIRARRETKMTVFPGEYKGSVGIGCKCLQRRQKPLKSPKPRVFCG